MKMLNEGAMSDIDLLAKESKDFKTFVKAFQKEYSNLDAGSFKELEAWLKTVYDSAKNESNEVNEAAHVPSNIMDFAKNKGSYAVALVKKAATWAEKSGKRISGGTAIGKNYSTIILDMKHQGSEIYINLDKETIELFGDEVTDPKSFAKVLATNESTVNESTLEISGNAYSMWNDKKIQRELQDIKIKIVGDMKGVMTLSGDEEELNKVRAIFGIKESVVNEGNKDEQVKKECISRLSDFFRVSPNTLSKFNFDGKDNIKELTKALNSTSDQGTELYYQTAIKSVKKDLGVNESEVNEKYIPTFKKFINKK